MRLLSESWRLWQISTKCKCLNPNWKSWDNPDKRGNYHYREAKAQWCLINPVLMRKINQSNIKWQWRINTYRVECFCIYFCSCFPGAALPYGCRGVCIPAAARSEGRAQARGLKKKAGWAGPSSQQFLLPQKRGERSIRWLQIHKLSQWGFLEHQVPGTAVTP